MSDVGSMLVGRQRPSSPTDTRNDFTPLNPVIEGHVTKFVDFIKVEIIFPMLLERYLHFQFSRLNNMLLIQIMTLKCLLGV
jgi:hypothetical protein